MASPHLATALLSDCLFFNNNFNKIYKYINKTLIQTKENKKGEKKKESMT